MKLSIAFFLFFLLPVLLFGQSPLTYLHCGRVIDGTGGIEAEQIIVRIAAGYLGADAGAKTVDLKEHTVLPGFIDMHVHIELQSSLRAYSEKLVK